MDRCQCQTEKGTRCKRSRSQNSKYCFQHKNCESPVKLCRYGKLLNVKSGRCVKKSGEIGRSIKPVVKKTVVKKPVVKKKLVVKKPDTKKKLVVKKPVTKRKTAELIDISFTPTGVVRTPKGYSKQTLLPIPFVPDLLGADNMYEGAARILDFTKSPKPQKYPKKTKVVKRKMSGLNVPKTKKDTPRPTR